MTELNDPTGLICSLAAIRDARMTDLAISIDELRALGLVAQSGEAPSLTVDGQHLLRLADWNGAAA